MIGRQLKQMAVTAAGQVAATHTHIFCWGAQLLTSWDVFWVANLSLGLQHPEQHIWQCAEPRALL